MFIQSKLINPLLKNLIIQKLCNQFQLKTFRIIIHIFLLYILLEKIKIELYIYHLLQLYYFILMINYRSGYTNFTLQK